MDEVAEHRLRVRYSDGRVVAVRLRVGRPTARADGVWECAVWADGLVAGGGPLPTLGDSSWRALMGGLRFLYQLVRAELRPGAVLLSESSPYPVNLTELFPFDKPAEPPAAPDRAGE